MAYETTKKKIVLVGVMLERALSSFTKEKNRIYDLAEADFQNKVKDNGLSLEAQLAYRKDQLKQAMDADIPDGDYIKEIKSNISDLNKLNRAQKFTDAYMAQYTDLKADRQTIYDHINFLNDQLASVVDSDLKNTIQDKIAEAEESKANYEETILANKVTYAMDDKTLPILSKTISEVEASMAKALVNKNEAQRTKYDNYLLNLRSQLEGVKIQNIFHDLDVANMTKPQTAKGLLDFYTNNLKNSNNQPISLKVGDTTYTSIKDFWQAKLNGYIQEKFFIAYQQEQKNKLDTASATLSPVLRGAIESVNSDIDGLKSNSVLAPYLENLEQVRTSLNFDAISNLSKKVSEDYWAGRLGKTTVENYNNAVNSLTSLNKKYNVDVTQDLNSIIQDYAQKKAAVASNITDVAATLMKDKGLSKEEALKEAEKTVPSMDIPDIKIAEMKPSEIAEAQIGQVEGKASDYDLNKKNETMEQPLKSDVPKIDSTVLPRGEQIPVPELLRWIQKENIIKDTASNKVFLRQGVNPNWKKVLNPTELQTTYKGYKEGVDLLKASDNSYYAKIK